MTQRELIIFCKENDPNYTKEASFKRLEPMWSIPKGIGGIGITESEFKNGFYVEIDTKGRKGFEHLEGRVFYFREKVDPSKFCFQIYIPAYKKFYVPLNALENWGKEIVKEVFIGKGIIEQIEPPIKYEPMTPEELETQKALYDSVQSLEAMKPVEEFPIQKIQGKTTYSKRNSFIVIGKDSENENIILQDLAGKEFAHTKESFSDLVDLMIEARKDLLK